MLVGLGFFWFPVVPQYQAYTVGHPVFIGCTVMQASISHDTRL